MDLGCCGDLVTDEFNVPLFCLEKKKSLSINKRIPLQLGFTVKHSAPACGNCSSPVLRQAFLVQMPVVYCSPIALSCCSDPQFKFKVISNWNQYHSAKKKIIHGNVEEENGLPNTLTVLKIPATF